MSKKPDESGFVRISHLRSIIPIKSYSAIKKIIKKDEDFPKPYEIGKSLFYKKDEVENYMKSKQIIN